VQRALSAKSMSAARRTPLIGAYPKIFIPALTVIPGLVALVSVRGLGGSAPDQQYNTAIPALISHYFPEGMLGLAVTGLLAAFMAGVAANVTSFNTVVTYDLWQDYVRKDRDEQYYLRVGRIATVVGLLISVATAFIAKGYSNMMNYVQLLFSYFNAPLFATFIIAMFWRRTTPWAGFWGLIAGFLGAFITHEVYSFGWVDLGSELAASFWGAVVAFIADAVVTVAVTLVTQPKPEDELRGLVWGLPRRDAEPERVSDEDRVWYRSPMLLGMGALALIVVLNIIFI
jgi:SSS family solute:Na+ symporter